MHTSEVFTEITCSPPPTGVNTEVVPDTNFKAKETYEYQCLSGYIPFYPYINNNATECLESKKWSLDPPMSCTSKCLHY